MPFAWASVIGKMTRSLSSSSGSEDHLDVVADWAGNEQLRTFGTDARRAVGSTATLPSAAMVPDRNVSDEICPSPTARRLKMNRQPFSGAPVWSGCRTMLGLNKADASNEYSWRKYAPIRRRCVLFSSACGSSAVFHFCGARLEDIEQIPVTTFEILEHLAQLLRGGFGIEPKNPVDDMIGPDLVGGIEVSGLSRRFEGPDDDPGRSPGADTRSGDSRIGIETMRLPGVVRGAIE